MFLSWHNEEPKWQSVNSLELHLIDKICGFSNTTAAVIYVSNAGYLQVGFGFTWSFNPMFSSSTRISQQATLSQFWFVSLCPVCFIQFGFSSHWQLAFGHNCLPAYLFSSCVKSFTWESQHSQIAPFSFWGKYILMMLYSRLWAFRQRWIECKHHWEIRERREAGRF